MNALPVRVAGRTPQVARIQAGGSAWWYADLLDAHGSGVVLVAAIGLPFLPGYASATRRGAAEKPSDHASVVLSTYRNGRPDFYALHHVPHIEPSEDGWRWDGSDLRFRTHADGGCSFSASITGELPGCPWSAEIDIHGPLRTPTADEPEMAPHEWSLLTAGHGTAVVDAGGDRFEIAGRGYVDRNLSETALTGRWHWGRASVSDGDTLVWYTDGNEGFSLLIGGDGSTIPLPAPRTTGTRRGSWGLPRPAKVEVGTCTFDLGDALDDGPFYTRVLVRDGQGRSVGFAESCHADRIDRVWSRPLVRMVVAGAGSPWLPLFCGPRRGRFGRFVRHASGRR